MTSVAPDLSTLEIYEHWAPTYPPEPHNPLMRAEQECMMAQLPDASRLQALDLACGSGRYARLLASAGASRVVAADFSSAMLSRVTTGDRVRADLTHLPFTADSFDLVVSGLAIGHAGDLGACLKEIARVLRPGGTVCYSDFHCEAARRGLTRSFRDATDRSFTLPPAGFEIDEHRTEAQRAGLVIESIHELRVGEELREPFKDSEEFYRRWHGVPLVLVIRARK